MQPRSPSGLFPAAPDGFTRPAGPVRPTFREPHPVRRTAVAGGAALTAVWLLLFGLLGGSPGAVARWLIVASLLAWAAAYGLSRYGDRGAATGVAITAGIGLAGASAITIVQWATEGWPLW